MCRRGPVPPTNSRLTGQMESCAVSEAKEKPLLVATLHRGQDDTDMGLRALVQRVPIWVRVPGIIALVLLGVVVGTMLFGASGVGGGHGSGAGTEMKDHEGGRGGRHGSGAGTEMKRHEGGQRGGHRSGAGPQMRDHERGQTRTGRVVPPGSAAIPALISVQTKRRA